MSCVKGMRGRESVFITCLISAVGGLREDQQTCTQLCPCLNEQAAWGHTMPCTSASPPRSLPSFLPSRSPSSLPSSTLSISLLSPFLYPLDLPPLSLPLPSRSPSSLPSFLPSRSPSSLPSFPPSLPFPLSLFPLPLSPSSLLTSLSLFPPPLPDTHSPTTQHTMYMYLTPYSSKSHAVNVLGRAPLAALCVAQRCAAAVLFSVHSQLTPSAGISDIRRMWLSDIVWINRSPPPPHTSRILPLGLL